MFFWMMCCALLFSAPTRVVHEYYISTSEITYNPKTNELEIAITCVGHDVERWFQKKKQIAVSLESKDKEFVKKNLNTLLQEQFSIQVSGNTPNFELIGFQISKGDQLDMFITCKLPENTQSFSILNNILTDLYMFQENIMHFKHNGKTQSAYCTRRAPEAIFNLK